MPEVMQHTGPRCGEVHRTALELDVLASLGTYCTLADVARITKRSLAGLRSGVGQSWRRSIGLEAVRPEPPSMFDGRRTYFRVSDLRAALLGTASSGGVSSGGSMVANHQTKRK